MATGNKGGSNNEYFSMQIDEKLKSDFTHFCDMCGYTVSDAVMMLAKRTIKDGKVPFAIEPLSIYTDSVGDTSTGKPKSARLTVRMDHDLQEEFSVACNDIGITRSVLVRMFFAKSLSENKIPL